MLTIGIMMICSAFLGAFVNQIIFFWELYPIKEEKSVPLYITKKVDFE